MISRKTDDIYRRRQGVPPSPSPRRRRHLFSLFIFVKFSFAGRTRSRKTIQRMCFVTFVRTSSTIKQEIIPKTKKM